MRGRIVALQVAGMVLAVGCRSYAGDTGVRYFIHVDGSIAVRGAVNETLQPNAGSGVYGAAEYRKGLRRLTLDFSFKGGSLNGTIEDVAGTGEQTMEGLEIGWWTAGATSSSYTCGSGCNPCIVIIEEFGDEAIAGRFSCSGLRSCGDGTPVGLPDGDPECGGTRSTVVDVSAEFRLGDPRAKPLDY